MAGAVYNGGPKFTLIEREQMKQRAWELHKQGLSQTAICMELDVGQASISRWLKDMAARQPTPQLLIAAKIRAELVCCNLYDRFMDMNNPYDQMHLKGSPDWHENCFYGGWAARIAEQA